MRDHHDEGFNVLIWVIIIAIVLYFLWMLSARNNAAC